MEIDDDIKVVVADASHEKYVDIILATITDSAKKRGSGIASRKHEYLATKMRERKAIIALAGPSATSKAGATRHTLQTLD